MRATLGRLRSLDRQQQQAGSAVTGDRPMRAEADADHVFRLWLDNYDYLYRLCLGWTRGNPAEADDLLGQTLMRMLRHGAANFEGLGSPRGWVVRVARNLWLDGARSRSRADNYQNEVEQVLHSSAPPPPDAALFGSELGQRLAAAIDDLPLYLRAALVQRHIDGLAYREIAERNSISQSTARKRCQLARDRVRAQLQDVQQREAYEVDVCPV